MQVIPSSFNFILVEIWGAFLMVFVSISSFQKKITKPNADTSSFNQVFLRVNTATPYCCSSFIILLLMKLTNTLGLINQRILLPSPICECSPNVSSSHPTETHEHSSTVCTEILSCIPLRNWKHVVSGIFQKGEEDVCSFRAGSVQQCTVETRWRSYLVSIYRLGMMA